MEELHRCADHDVYKRIIMDFILAHSRYRRGKFPQAISICDELLRKNEKDEAAWMLKCSCLIKENYIDQLETEEQTIADTLIQEDATNHLARAGTSFKNTQKANPIMRPTQGGRINTGFQQVGTAQSRANSRSGNRMLRTGRTMTKAGIPVTSNGRILRLSTASLQQYGEGFLDSSKINLRRVAERKSKARLIFLYLFYVEHNLKKALQLAVYSTELNHYADAWWKLSLGKCYYHLGFLKEAEKQFISSQKHNNNIDSYLYLSKIHEKEDSVEKSIGVLKEAMDIHPYEPKLHICVARIYDKLGNIEESHQHYRNALALQNCNVEAVANFASYFFYKDQMEISAKLYQRLIQLGYESPQIWNNMALCCFYSNQHQVFYTCFERALAAANEDEYIASDIWYNIGCVFIQLGELDMALEALQNSLSSTAQNCAALNNIAVIYSRLKNITSAINYAEKSFREENNFQAAYNLSIWYYNSNQLEKSAQFNREALRLHPLHPESQQFADRLQKKLNTL